MELGRFATLFKGYTELRLQHNEVRRVMLVNGSVVNNRSVSRGGVSARVRDRGAWGFASDADAGESGVERVIRAATDNARWLGTHGARDAGPLSSPVGGSVDRFNTARRRWTSAEVVDFLEELDRRIKE